MKALVLWADSESANLGVRVLADGSRHLLQKAFGNRIEVDAQDFASGESDVAFNGDAVKDEILRRDFAIRERLQQYDLILDTGAGDSFTDIYGLKRLLLMTYVREQARLAHVPVVFGPQTIGPFYRRGGRLLARRGLRYCSGLLARDSASAAEARRLGACPVGQMSDVVFSLPLPSVGPTRDVILNVSGLLWMTDQHGPAKQYHAVVRNLVRCLGAAGRQVTLFAHVLDSPNIDNDVPSIHELASTSMDSLEILVPASLSEARRLLAGANLVIGSRMHACLNALSVGTPTIPLGYSPKFQPLLKDLGWPYMVDLRQAPDPVKEVVHLVDQLDRRNDVAELIDGLQARAAQLSERGSRFLARLL